VITTTSHESAENRIRFPLSFADEHFLMFEMDALAEKQEGVHDDVIRLTLGKSELPPSGPVIAAMQEAIADHGQASLVYPAGLPQLQERLARYYLEQHGVAIPPHRFVITPGTSCGFRNLHQILSRPGDEILVPSPYYPLYVFTARLAGATVRYYRIDPSTMRVDLDSLEAAISDRTRVIVVNSPGNPLGNLVSEDQLLRIDAMAAGRVVLISDEIYGNVIFGGGPYSAIRLAGQLSCPLVVTSGFSKGHRMYARRVGYLLVPEWLVEPLVVTQHHTLLTTDPVGQFGAIAALDHSEDLEQLTALHRRRSDYALRKLAGTADVRAFRPEGGFYLTLDCGAYLRRHDICDESGLARDILSSVHVATVPGSDFGLPGTLRLSFTSERFEEAIDRLVAFFAVGPAR
jgi:aspartate/methionine/tyrosine aminotransferase